MKILVALNHPAHYYVFKNAVLELKERGYIVKYVIRQKDVLENLLISEKVEYLKVSEKRNRKRNAISVLSNGFIELVKQDFNLLKFVLKWRPTLMIGTDIAITHVGSLLKIPSFVFNEDDYEINKLFCKTSYPFATKIISPDVCSVGKYTRKKIAYQGFQKMAYLHPKYFKPDRDHISDLVGTKDEFFVIRLVSLTSGHDIEGVHTGLNEIIIEGLISELKKYGKILITCEGYLNPKFEEYRLSIAPNKMHHLLAFAKIFIGDSQTMCAEAGLLGTPFIRFNDFVGKISYLNEIENKYQLGYGITTKMPGKVFETVKEILNIPNLNETWHERKLKIFEDKIDVTKFYVDLIVNQVENKG